ncbi:uncharacterized protein LOC127240893 [Andrographis paniculata]|uniref:uncharacterized protein LOC127240893 n=1 Tax=Andrographis paniculata TaxID=175694 RepID=UPI0021E8933C|nr:uncharacterized protein LOC127240893 [Andrographis paniculata]
MVSSHTLVADERRIVQVLEMKPTELCFPGTKYVGWDDDQGKEKLKLRYGAQRPLIYQKRRDLSRLYQGNLSMAAYFNRMQSSKDELSCLAPVPVDRNEVDLYLHNLEAIDYLMGLNDNFDAVRNQILMMDPLSDVNKIYGILSTVEKQQEVHDMLKDPSPTVLLANSRTSERKLDKSLKTNLVCDHCKRNGHVKAEC